MSERARAWIGAALGFALAFVLVTALLPEPSAPLAAFVPVADRSIEAGVPAGELVAPELERAAPRPGAPAAAAPSTHGQAAEALGASTLPDAPDELGLVLFGLVSDPSGAPVPGAFVLAPAPDGARPHVATDERGRYALGPLAPGTRRVVASKIHHHEHAAEIAPDAGPSPRRQDFVLRPEQRIRVRLVTSRGVPTVEALAGTEIRLHQMQVVPVATAEDPGELFTAVRGSLNNRFGIGSFWQNGFNEPSLGRDVYGTVSLHEDGPAWLLLVVSHQVLRKERVTPATAEVTFVVDPEDLLALRGALHAQLRDAASGEPLAGRVWLGENAYPMGRGEEVGADGAVRLEGQWPGARWFAARAEGRALLVREVTIARGATLELGDVLLHEAVALRGQVRLASGEPVEAVLRWGRLEPGGSVAWARQVSARSRPDGSFAIEGLEPAVWVLQSPGLPATPPRPFDARRASLPLRVDATRGTVEGLEVVLIGTGAVTLATSDVVEPWPSARALDGAGLPGDSTWLGRYGDESVLNLVPGRYVLVVEREGGRARAAGDRRRRGAAAHRARGALSAARRCRASSSPPTVPAASSTPSS